jgi:hypothetical protein
MGTTIGSKQSTLMKLVQPFDSYRRRNKNEELKSVRKGFCRFRAFRGGFRFEIQAKTPTKHNMRLAPYSASIQMRRSSPSSYEHLLNTDLGRFTYVNEMNHRFFIFAQLFPNCFLLCAAYCYLLTNRLRYYIQLAEVTEFKAWF